MSKIKFVLANEGKTALDYHGNRYTLKEFDKYVNCDQCKIESNMMYEATNMRTKKVSHYCMPCVFKGKTIIPAFTQILYVPTHLLEIDYKNPERWMYPNGVQPGWVLGHKRETDYFCRYWSMVTFFDDLPEGLPELRTKANSEMTDAYNLVIWNTIETDTFERTLTKLGFM